MNRNLYLVGSPANKQFLTASKSEAVFFAALPGYQVWDCQQGDYIRK